MIGRVAAAAYVTTIAGVATVGFVSDTTSAILLAGALALPSSVPAVVGFYLAYGFLALAPGANPSESSGSSSCRSDGVCVSTSAGDLAPWFAITTDILGVAALTGAAMVNVLVCWRLWAARRGGRRGPPQFHHGG